MAGQPDARASGTKRAPRMFERHDGLRRANPSCGLDTGAIFDAVFDCQHRSGASMSAMPANIVAVDVETTGLYQDDRIVTLGAWRIRGLDSASGEFNADCIHIIANPGRKSHSMARSVHGYSDSVLRDQQPFSEHAEIVREFLTSGDVVVAHNASFDFRFIEREYLALGQTPIKCRQFCTMSGYRQSGLPGKASLSAICDQIGLKRVGKTHGALEDAWLALMIFLWLKKAPPKFIVPFSDLIPGGIPVIPSNFKDVSSPRGEIAASLRSPEVLVSADGKQVARSPQ